MERPPYIFRAITHFSIGDVEKYDPRLDEITKLTLEIGSKIPPGRYPIVLIQPFAPLGRPGEDLIKLAALRADGINSIWVFRKPDDVEWARVEIRGKAPGTSIFVRCKRTEGVHGWDEREP